MVMEAGKRMYVPVMHARMSERLALDSIIEKLREAKNVHPLAIPVRDDSDKPGIGLRNTVAWIKLLSKLKLPYSILVTPYAAKVEQTQAQIQAALLAFDKNKMGIPVVAVTSSKPIATLEAEIASLPAGPFGVLHQSPAGSVAKVEAALAVHAQRIQRHFFYGDECDDTYCANWELDTRVLIEDGFRKLERNADYANKPDEEFSDLAFRYAKDGFQGYGDHTIVGEHYKPGGFTAQHVAIHLTYPAPLSAKYKTVRMRHFVSPSASDDVTPAGCYLEARAALVEFYDENWLDLHFSTACGEFKANSSFPGLMTVKRLSIQHHVELMSHLNL